MSYKIENGKIYEVKELNKVEFEKEVKQAVAFIKQHKNDALPFESEIVLKKAEFNKLTEKYTSEINALQAEVKKHTDAIEAAKASLDDKKEIIAQLYPDASKVLGF